MCLIKTRQASINGRSMQAVLFPFLSNYITSLIFACSSSKVMAVWPLLSRKNEEIIFFVLNEGIRIAVFIYCPQTRNALFLQKTKRNAHLVHRCCTTNSGGHLKPRTHRRAQPPPQEGLLPGSARLPWWFLTHQPNLALRVPEPQPSCMPKSSVISCQRRSRWHCLPFRTPVSLDVSEIGEQRLFSKRSCDYLRACLSLG